MVVREGELVLAIRRHLHPDSRLADPPALRLVGLEKVFSGVAVEAAHAEVLPLSVLALVV